MTQSYKTILVAVDGSKGELALHKAIHVALRNQARLIIAHVIDTRALHNVVAFDASVYESLERERSSSSKNTNKKLSTPV